MKRRWSKRERKKQKRRKKERNAFQDQQNHLLTTILAPRAVKPHATIRHSIHTRSQQKLEEVVGATTTNLVEIAAIIIAAVILVAAVLTQVAGILEAIQVVGTLAVAVVVVMEGEVVAARDCMK